MGNFELPTVSVVRFEGGAPDNYQAGIEDALSYQGGIDQFVKPGQRVLLKPDLMYDYPGSHGLTTSPEFIAAVARMVKNLGAEAVIGDSPFVLRGEMDDFWRNTGILDVAQRDQLELVNFEMSGSRAVALETKVYYVSRAVLEADVVINLPRLKYDSRVGIAGGVRNMLGTLPGFQKGRLYKEFSSGRNLAGALVDIFSAVRPTLTIAEAVPCDGRRQSSLDNEIFAIASSDTVALDTVLAEILRLDACKVFTTRIAAEAGLGIGWLEGVKIEGVPLDMIGREFKPPARGGASVFQKVVRGIVQPQMWMKSSVNEELCAGCGTCIDLCPTNALKVVDGSRAPSINYSLCICCWAGLSNCPTSAFVLEESRQVGRLFPA